MGVMSKRGAQSYECACFEKPQTDCNKYSHQSMRKIETSIRTRGEVQNNGKDVKLHADRCADGAGSLALMSASIFTPHQSAAA